MKQKCSDMKCSDQNSTATQFSDRNVKKTKKTKKFWDTVWGTFTDVKQQTTQLAPLICDTLLYVISKITVSFVKRLVLSDTANELVSRRCCGRRGVTCVPHSHHDSMMRLFFSPKVNPHLKNKRVTDFFCKHKRVTFTFCVKILMPTQIEKYFFPANYSHEKTNIQCVKVFISSSHLDLSFPPCHGNGITILQSMADDS